MEQVNLGSCLMENDFTRETSSMLSKLKVFPLFFLFSFLLSFFIMFFYSLPTLCSRILYLSVLSIHRSLLSQDVTNGLFCQSPTSHNQVCIGVGYEGCHSRQSSTFPFFFLCHLLLLSSSCCNPVFFWKYIGMISFTVDFCLLLMAEYLAGLI